MTPFDTYLYRGPRPSLSEVIAGKFQLVISLESGVYEFFHDDDLESAEHANGKLFEMSPMSDFFPPSKLQVGRVLEILKTSQASKIQTLLHCKSGVDRTGFVVAVYRMQVQGWSYSRAHAEWVAMGRHWRYFWWAYWLRKYEGK